MSLEVRAARPEDAAALAPRLRAADLREIAAATGEAPLEVLARGIAWSAPALSAIDPGGRVVAVFGVVPDDRGGGLIWLLGSDDLVRHPRTLVKAGRAWLDRMQERYPRLWNHVDTRNEVHVRWLLRCGFEVVRTEEAHGVEGRPFHEVERVLPSRPPGEQREQRHEDGS